MDVLNLLPTQTRKSSLNLKNKKLSEHTKAIGKLLYDTKRSIFEISARLLIIRNENLFEDDFKDVFEYAEKLFGYKKNMVYKLMATAEKFIEQNPQGEGYVSILIHDDKDYTVSQLIELNSIESDEAIKLDEDELISPDMSTKEIREVVKAYKRGEIDEKGNFISNVSESEEETESEPKTNGVDGTALSIMNMITDISKILDDERIIKDALKVAKLQEMKKFLESIEL